MEGKKNVSELIDKSYNKMSSFESKLVNVKKFRKAL